MTEPNQSPTTVQQTEVPTTPFRCFTGAILSGGMALAMYKLVIAIATNLANKPIHSNNPLVLNLSSLVRTAVLGVIMMGTGIFGIVTLGLLALGLQVLIQKVRNKK
ncbi:MAG: DUF3082 domain-containing protein [Richelia sp.]|nr:DUF3082 domain-containing protein [Richelia sp.]CDN15327.1 hypothetical protein RintRC_5435 [Richelia intracellularis]